MKRIYVPLKWTLHGRAYRQGWADAAFGTEVVHGAWLLSLTDNDKLAYEAGHRDWWAQNPQEGGGA